MKSPNLNRLLVIELLAASLFILCLTPLSWADKRSRSIDFDDDVIEGVNRQPLDSFNQLSDAEKRKRKIHLYRKRTGFKLENEWTLKVTRVQS